MSKPGTLHKDPLIRIAKRGQMALWKSILIRAGALVAALLINALFVYLVTGLGPVALYSTMIQGAFGNGIKIWRTVTLTVKLLFIAIALGIAFKMRFWNIGGEGPVLVGALATSMVMVYLGDSVPNGVLFVLMFLASVLAGGLWGAVPAFFKARWNTNETLFTLMMNYIAIQLVAFFCNMWKGDASTLGKLNKISEKGWFPALKVPFLNNLPDQRGMINVITVLVLMVLVFFYLSKTKHGYEISVVGGSPNTARYAGINVRSVIIRTMILSGAICGVCGMMNVAGFDQTLSVGTAGGYGFTAIIVAWMAGFNTFYMLLISLFMVFLEIGTGQIANSYTIIGFTTNATAIVIGVILFFMVGCEFFIRYRLVFRKNAEKREG